MDSDIVLAEVPRSPPRASLIADRSLRLHSREMEVVGGHRHQRQDHDGLVLAQPLTSCGRPAAYLGTLGAAFGGEPSGRAHQRCGEWPATARELRDAGAQAVAMEVSSHALVQDRVAAVRFQAAVFTNLTRDHLDFHGDMDRYGAAKASLFERSGLPLRVVNVDDAFGALLASRPGFDDRIACTRNAAPHALHGRFVRAHRAEFSRAGMRFDLESSFGSAVVRTPSSCVQWDNVLAVLAVLLGTRVPLTQAVAALGALCAPRGRLESFVAAERPLVLVDYAHTPDALAKALEVVRQHAAGRVICVFGCGGDRDRGKRPLMGAVAARGADSLVLTDDNPRSEDPAAIIADIEAGVGSTRCEVIHDRRQAIGHAIAMAGPDDGVLVAGKGHETVQIVGAERWPFSDQRVVRDALALQEAS